ncbi:MAG: hypothetical protein KKA62_06215 [Nanoarchaeota archaeon]|nr:hypothetical protein [Nanoarchaeota archaeon]MBU1644176.1 hypothetical protein [Nanoarchaeota archaeon]MBU1977519.1 hypothetical protein [Nanoarchaeota archaeon]
MAYHLGKYRTIEGKEYDLCSLTPTECKLFNWLREEYINADSWKDFQDRTARPIVEAAMKAAETRTGEKQFQWENYFLYKIRYDLLRNVGVRTGELKGELSDMIIEELKN